MSTVYILTNEAMPGLVKIGRTDGPLADRMRALDSCGVPLPFQCYFAARVENSVFVEAKLHEAFGDFRLRPRREFFQMDPLRAKAALELAALEDVTPRQDIVEYPEDVEALERAVRRAPRFRFSNAQVPIGAEISFARDPAVTATVVSDREILFEGKTASLTGAAVILLEREGLRWKGVQGPLHWIYEGETLAERRQRIEASG